MDDPAVKDIGRSGRTRKVIAASAGLLCLAISGAAQAEPELIRCTARFLDPLKRSGYAFSHAIRYFYSDIFRVSFPFSSTTWPANLNRLEDAFVETLDSPEGEMDYLRCALQNNDITRATHSFNYDVKQKKRFGYTVIRTNWVPDATLLAGGKVDSVDEGVIRDGVFNREAQKPIKKWMKQNKISSTGDIASTLALMVQTALVLQSFDPGPADGVVGKRTLAAIAAWHTARQAMRSLSNDADLADVLAAILWTSLLLQGHDPGPLWNMFGPAANTAVQTWAWRYQEARSTRASGKGKRIPASAEEKSVPDALHCVSIPRSKNRAYQFVRNNCNFTIDVHWCYETRNDGFRCKPGPAGLDYVKHRLQHHPVYYQSREVLEAHETTRQILPRGKIRFIACGVDHLKGEGATYYKMEWDVHNGRFRCLALFPDPGDPKPVRAVE